MTLPNCGHFSCPSPTLAACCMPTSCFPPCCLACSLDGPCGVILQECCEGRDLHSALQLPAAGGTGRAFGWYRRGRRIALDCAKALNYLHSQVRPWVAVRLRVQGEPVVVQSGAWGGGCAVLCRPATA